MRSEGLPDGSARGLPHLPSVGRRGGRRRDRHGRGPRGPGVLPGPHSPTGVPGLTTRRAAFDRLVLEVVQDLEERWHAELGLVEFAVEETPLVPDDWSADTVPLATLVPGSGGTPTRLVLFRRPIELRTETSADLAALVHTVLVEQVSELLGRPPEEIDPRYDAEE